jgi:hypothetical protein
MKKIVTLLLSLFLTVGTAFADNSQVVIINGQEVQKVATKITFSGDNATVSFSDGSSQTADMAQVVIYLNVTTDIRKVETFSFNGLIGDVLTLSNVAEGTTVTIYDATGKVLQQVKATDTTLSLNTASLKNGVYVLKAGNQIVKFLKK